MYIHKPNITEENLDIYIDVKACFVKKMKNNGAKIVVFYLDGPLNSDDDIDTMQIKTDI